MIYSFYGVRGPASGGIVTRISFQNVPGPLWQSGTYAASPRLTGGDSVCHAEQTHCALIIVCCPLQGPHYSERHLVVFTIAEWISLYRSKPASVLKEATRSIGAGSQRPLLTGTAVYAYPTRITTWDRSLARARYCTCISHALFHQWNQLVSM